MSFSRKFGNAGLWAISEIAMLFKDLPHLATEPVYLDHYSYPVLAGFSRHHALYLRILSARGHTMFWTHTSTFTAQFLSQFPKRKSVTGRSHKLAATSKAKGKTTPSAQLKWHHRQSHKQHNKAGILSGPLILN